MWPRYLLDDIRVVGHYLGTLVLLTSAAMLIPCVVALLDNDFKTAIDFLCGAGFALFGGGCLRMCKISPNRLSRKQALMVVAFGWFIISLFGAVPMYLSGQFASPFDAVFDALSALTTTGFSFANDYDHMPGAQLLWRSLLTLVGGQGVIVVALSLGFFGRGGGGATAIYKAEARNDQVLPNVIGTSRFIWITTFALIVVGTVIATIICLVEGFEPLKALLNGFILTVSAYDTGGMTPHSTSLVYYHSLPIELFCLVFMLMGIVNFAIFSGLLRGHIRDFFADTETKWVVIWLSVMVAIFTVVLLGDGFYTTLPELLRRGTYMAVSACTTAGFQTVYSSQMGFTYTGGAMVVLLIVMIVGGVSGSTAGGIKISRLAIIVRWVAQRIRAFLMPPSAVTHSTYHHHVDIELDSSVATQAMIVFILFAFTAITGCMIGIAYGYDAIPAMFESVACVSSNGISTGIMSPDIPFLLKFFYFLEMWAGRLEFIALLAVLAGIISSVAHGVGKIKKRGHERRLKKLPFMGIILAVALIGSAGFAPTAQASMADTGYSSNQRVVQQEANNSINDVITTLGGTVLTQEERSEQYTETTIAALTAFSPDKEDTIVRFSGEAIGDIIDADASHVWVNLLGRDSLVGVYMTREQADEIVNLGRNGVKGTELSVVGSFHSDCVLHDGELDVHAIYVSAVSPGGTLPSSISTKRITFGAVCAVMGGILLLVYRYRRRARL